MKIKINVWERPNKIHLEIQQRNRAHVFKARKGKGSYKRERVDMRAY